MKLLTNQAINQLLIPQMGRFINSFYPLDSCSVSKLKGYRRSQTMFEPSYRRLLKDIFVFHYNKPFKTFCCSFYHRMFGCILFREQVALFYTLLGMCSN